VVDVDLAEVCITSALTLVEDEGPVGEEQGGVGRVGLVGLDAPGLRLQLVAQIADIAEVELEGQACRRRHRPGAQLVIEVVEELLLNPLGGPVGPPDDDLAVSDGVGDVLGERTVSVTHHREARQSVDHRAAVEPEALVAAGEEGTVGRQRLGVNIEVLTAPVDGAVSMRVHERGVGETRSCGTGTVAAAVAALALCFACVELNEGPYWAAIMHVGRADAMAASGLLNTGGNAGGLVATPIVAYLSGHHAWTPAFLIGAGFAVASAAGWLLVDPTRRAAADAV